MVRSLVAGLVAFGITGIAGVAGVTSRAAAAPAANPAVEAIKRGKGADTIRGTVRFDGDPPERAKLHRESDPYCAKTEQRADDVVVTGGKLKDVLVRIKSGPGRAPNHPFAPPPAVIDQKDCAYAPRVIGVVAGQPVTVRNSDGTFHNVHGTIAGKQLWNKPAVPGAPELALDSSPRPGDVIEIACDVHPWMHAYAVVQDGAPFAITGDDGSFELAGLRPGTYTLEAWHPTLGTKTIKAKLNVGALGPATAQIAYGRADLPK